MFMNLKTPKQHSKFRHFFWLCRNYWNPKNWYNCRLCGKTLRCYWQGNDVIGHGIDYCDSCAKKLEGAR